MARIVSNEIPGGTINGVNKIFTTAYEYTQITNLVVDGVEYFDFTAVAGTNTITLTDAPTTSIYVDYISDTSPTGTYLQETDISTLRTNIRTTYLKIDPNAKVWDNNTLDYFINRAYSKVQQDFGFDIPECQEETTISATSGIVEYEKPSDLVKISGMFYETTELLRITKQDTQRYRSTSARPSSYYQYGNYIGLYPTPDTSYSITLYYNKKLPKITTAQGSVLDDDMNDLLVLWACYLLFISVEKQDKATMCLSQYTIFKDSLMSQKLYDDSSLTFSMERTYNTYRDDTL